MSTRRRSSQRRRPGRRTVGIAVLVIVVGLLGWVGYQYFLTNLLAAAAYRQQVNELRSSWQASPAAADRRTTGEAIGILRVPALGAGYEVPIVSGTDDDLLSHAVGHYTATALPGEVGNNALAGLRVTHGQPFARLHTLDPGDEIVVETRRALFTYVLDVAPRDLTVSSHASWVLQPVPGQPGAKPTQALLTLTTAQDVLPTSDRSVGFAHLASTQNKG